MHLTTSLFLLTILTCLTRAQDPTTTSTPQQPQNQDPNPIISAAISDYSAATSLIYSIFSSATGPVESVYDQATSAVDSVFAHATSGVSSLVSEVGVEGSSVWSEVTATEMPTSTKGQGETQTSTPAETKTVTPSTVTRQKRRGTRKGLMGSCSLLNGTRKTPPSLLSSLNTSLHASREKRSLEVTEQNFVTKDKQKNHPILLVQKRKKR
ncbi:hypothetical protein KCU99_g378, partial [Aureobasidium melanogenum]